MIVCSCFALSEKTIREMAPTGRTVKGTYRACGVDKLKCCICASTAQAIIKDELEKRRERTSVSDRPEPDISGH